MNANYYPNPAGALILSPDPLVGALFGALVDLTGLRPVYPTANETAMAAVRRLRPTLLLIDCADPCATDEAVLGPSMMTGVRRFLFGTEADLRELTVLAARYQLETIMIPGDVDRLTEILPTGAIGSIPRPPRSTAR